METRLPNKHWFDIIQLLYSLKEPTQLWRFDFWLMCNRHGQPIVRTEKIWVFPPRLMGDGNWYASTKRASSKPTDFMSGSLTRLGEFPWSYEARHGLYASRRQCLKARKQYEEILLGCYEDYTYQWWLADDIFLKLRGGSEFAPQDGVKRTDEQVVNKTPNGTDTDEFTDKKE